MGTGSEDEKVILPGYRESAIGMVKVANMGSEHVILYIARYDPRSGKRLEDQREIVYPSMLHEERSSLVVRLGEIDAQLALYEETISAVEPENP